MINPATKCSCAIDATAGRSDDVWLFDGKPCSDACGPRLVCRMHDGTAENDSSADTKEPRSDREGQDRPAETAEKTLENEKTHANHWHLEEMIITWSFVGE